MNRLVHNNLGWRDFGRENNLSLFLKMKTLLRARPNLPIFWNLTPNNIPDRHQCFQFQNSQKMLNHSTLLHTLPPVPEKDPHPFHPSIPPVLSIGTYILHMIPDLGILYTVYCILYSVSVCL